MERLREELQRRHEALNCQWLELREDKRRIEAEIANLVEAIALGRGAPSVMAAIADREEKINSLDNLRWQLAVTKPLPQTQVDLFSDMCRLMTTLGSVSLFYDVLSLAENVAQRAREMSVG